MKYLFSIAMISLLLACGNNEQSEKKDQILALDRETMEIHDEVMPLIDDMQRVSRDLRAMRSELEARPDIENQNVLLQEVDLVLEKLDLADNAMMTWMQHYKVYSTQKERPEEELLIYYQNEKLRITEIGQMMEESYQRGKVSLENIQNHIERHDQNQ